MDCYPCRSFKSKVHQQVIYSSKSSTAMLQKQVSRLNRVQTNRKNYEDFIVVWLDENIQKIDDTQKVIAELRKMMNRLEIFDNKECCLDFLRGIKREKLLLVLSDSFGQYVLPQINSIPQLASVYIFSADKIKHENCSSSFKIVHGIYTDITSLCEKIRNYIKLSSNDLQVINTIIVDDINKNRQEPSFMYVQILKDILVDMQHDIETEIKFIDDLRKEYAGKPA
ncbi:unnamed protein product [Rotaria sordida]|uniref:Uncharacterized protein n=1 Tax=Rotaria sordida TaxID=392033 RepID=A0A819WP73_9BILA|nr:unnamed protein product [Rotaria sordida]CAF4127881.1 unnamed protein product [Rotaria sordida]